MLARICLFAGLSAVFVVAEPIQDLSFNRAKGGEPAKEKSDLPEGALLRLGSTRFLHGGKILAVAFSPDGKLLASTAENWQDSAIRLWDVENGKEVASLKGHKGNVNLLYFLPSADPKAAATLVSGGQDSTIRFWNIKTQKELPQRINHPGPVSAMAISPDGKKVASGSASSKSIYLWEASSDKELLRFEAHPHGTVSLAFGPEGKTLASGGGMERALDARKPNLDKTLAVWDATSGKNLKYFTGHDFHVTGVALTPDGKTFIAAGPFFRKGSPVYFDVESGNLVRQLHGSCYRLVVSPDGKTMALADSGRRIHFYDVESGAAQLPLEHSGDDLPSRALAFSPDGSSLALGGENGRVTLWDIRRRSPKEPASSLTRPVRGLAVSPDGKVIVTLGDDGVLLWDRAKGELLRKLDPGEERRKTLAVSARFLPDNRQLMLTHHWKEGVSFWDWTKGQHERNVPLADNDRRPIRILSTSADGTLAVTGGPTEAKIDILDLRTGKSLRQLQAPKFSGRTDLRAAYLTPNGQYLLVIGFRHLSLYDVESGEVVYTKDRSGFGPTYAFSPGGLFMTEWGGGPGKVGLVETETGNKATDLPGTDRGHCEGILFSPDGRLLVLLQSGYRPGDASKADLIEVATGKVLKSLSAHRDKLRAAAFTPDGKALITGSDDCTALIWDISTLLAPEKALDIKAGWQELADADRRIAYGAFCRLRTASDAAIAFLKTQLKTDVATSQLEKARQVWAIRLLEDLNTAPARELLGILAKGDASERTTIEARGAQKRLQRAAPPPP